MANTKKLFATDESRTTSILLGGIVSLLAALAMAAAIWHRWGEVGVLLGPRGRLAVTICTLVGAAFALASGIWALNIVNRLSGRNAVKCIAGYFMDALALAIIGAFVLIMHFLKTTI